MLEGYKKCSGCRVIKPLEEFHNDNRNKVDGKVSKCKKCKSEYQKNRCNFTTKQKNEIKRIDFWSCQICGATDSLEVDHKIPQILCKPGKASCLDNGWTLCKRCNVAKLDKILLEVIQTVPRRIKRDITLEWVREQANSVNTERRPIRIGGKIFTEIVINKENKLVS